MLRVSTKTERGLSVNLDSRTGPSMLAGRPSTLRQHRIRSRERSRWIDMGTARELMMRCSSHHQAHPPSWTRTAPQRRPRTV